MRKSRLMKWFVTSLMTKRALLHRRGITDVKTNLAPLGKGSFVTPPRARAHTHDEVGDLIEKPSPFVVSFACWGGLSSCIYG